MSLTIFLHRCFKQTFCDAIVSFYIMFILFMRKKICFCTHFKTTFEIIILQRALTILYNGGTEEVFQEVLAIPVTSLCSLGAFVRRQLLPSQPPHTRATTVSLWKKQFVNNLWTSAAVNGQSWGGVCAVSVRVLPMTAHKARCTYAAVCLACQAHRVRRN